MKYCLPILVLLFSCNEVVNNEGKQEITKVKDEVYTENDILDTNIIVVENLQFDYENLRKKFLFSVSH